MPGIPQAQALPEYAATGSALGANALRFDALL
jgi:hypothetical protein